VKRSLRDFFAVMLTSENEEEKLSDTQKVENNAPPLKAMAFENVHVSLTSAIEAERKKAELVARDLPKPSGAAVLHRQYSI
jgi:hypothetical protein